MFIKYWLSHHPRRWCVDRRMPLVSLHHTILEIEGEVGPFFERGPRLLSCLRKLALIRPGHSRRHPYMCIPSWSGIVLSATGAVKKKGLARTPAHMAQTIEQYYAHILFSLTEHGRECCEKDHFSLTSNSWHYSCPLSVYCRSIVFLLVV